MVTKLWPRLQGQPLCSGRCPRWPIWEGIIINQQHVYFPAYAQLHEGQPWEWHQNLGSYMSYYYVYSLTIEKNLMRMVLALCYTLCFPLNSEGGRPIPNSRPGQRDTHKEREFLKMWVKRKVCRKIFEICKWKVSKTQQNQQLHMNTVLMLPQNSGRIRVARIIRVAIFQKAKIQTEKLF